MRPLWKGSISFGLVNIPVRLFAATEQKNVKFRYLHEPCRTPVEYRKVCPTCKKEVPMEEIVKGYEYEKGRFVVIEESDLARIPEETTRSIAIVDFVRQEEVDPVYYDRSYFLAPGETGEKAFQLLQQSMAEADMVAVVRIVLRSRQALGVLRVYEHTLAVSTMFYPDEVRSTAGLPAWNREVKISDTELKMARELIKNLTAPFTPEKYTDEYRKSLLEIIEAKIAGEEVYMAPAAQKGEVVDLMEALKASLDDRQGPARKQGESVGKRLPLARLELSAPLERHFGSIKPMEPRPAEAPFDDPEYVYQIKWDGIRILAFLEKGRVRLQNRKGRDRTAQFPELQHLAELIRSEEALLDGEVVVMEGGKPSFPRVIQRDFCKNERSILPLSRKLPCTYCLFDLLFLDGKDLTGEPLVERQQLLSEVAPSWPFT